MSHHQTITLLRAKLHVPSVHHTHPLHMPSPIRVNVPVLCSSLFLPLMQPVPPSISPLSSISIHLSAFISLIQSSSLTCRQLTRVLPAQHNKHTCSCDHALDTCFNCACWKFIYTHTVQKGLCLLDVCN